MSNAARTVIVTGASGFIGSWCSARFAREGWAVIGIDRRDVDALAPARPDFAHFAVDDLAVPDPMCSLIDRHAPHVIIHAAGPASVEHSFRNPQSDFAGQILPWISVLEAARLTGSLATVVLCSSAAVYGNPVHLPVAESAVLRPISPYGYHKLLAEILLQEYVDLHGVNASIARIFSTFGPGLDRLAVWEIAFRMMTGDYKVHGTGDETRDYLYIEDVATALLRIAENAPHCGEAYNVASGTETKIVQLARLIAQELGLNKANVAGDPSAGETKGKPSRWRADVTALSEIGISRSVTLAEGLKRTVNWIKSV